MAYTGAFTPGRTLTMEVGDIPVAAPLHPDHPQVALLNIGPELVFVALGVGPLEPDDAGYPVPMFVPTILTKGVGADSIVAWCEDGVATLYVTPGSGA